MANKILLPNGCSMSKPSVNPKNWLTGGKSVINQRWRIQYYFYNENFDKKLVVVKGMNSYRDLTERRNVTKLLIENEIEINKKGYNHFLKKFIVDAERNDNELHPDLPFISAFELVKDKLLVSESQKLQLKWAVERLKKPAKKLKLDDVTIYNLKRSELKRLLDSLDLPNNYYNKFKDYLSSLFNELVEYECCETNITRDIRKRKVIKKSRDILSKDDFEKVMKHLKENYYEFYRYAQIFLYSGARSTEFMDLKVKDVDIENQEFKITIKKGKVYKEQIKVILKAAIPFWEEILKGAKQNDYVFSKNLCPGSVSIRSYQITKRWYRLVKKKLDIKEDFYALKHYFLDSLPTEEAKQLASHTNTRTTSIYQVNKEKRDREELKKINISF